MVYVKDVCVCVWCVCAPKGIYVAGTLPYDSPTAPGNQSKATTDFGVNAKFDLDTSLAAYSLLIELQVGLCTIYTMHHAPCT
ncbi:hypothetical protein EON65_19370, partial [archaeon]